MPLGMKIKQARKREGEFIMTFCSNCGTKMEEGAKFCPSCGTSASGNAPAVAKSVTTGQIKKCPSCGAEMGAFEIKCPTCGAEISNVKSSAAVREFFEKISSASGMSDEDESSRMQAIPIYSILGGIIAFLFGAIGPSEGSPFPPVPCFVIGVLLFIVGIFTIKPKWSPSDKLKESYIANFPIPNSREDILEFLAISSSQIENVNAIATIFLTSAKLKAKWNAIWRKKCKQVYTKAKITMASDPQALSQIKAFLKEAKIKL
jgi:predicted RNA-binding Zn-ribbon protein involved in translation (DUF1610 family)